MDNPFIIFTIGMVLLALFIWYFGAEKDRTKRNVGTALTVGLAGFCLFAISQGINLGMDLSGGVRFTLQFNPEVGRTLSENDKKDAEEILRKRLSDPSGGTKDIQVYSEDDDRIIVDIPQGTSAEEISKEKLDEWRTAITRAAQLNFQMGHPNDAGMANNPDDVPPGAELLPIRPSNDPEKPNAPFMMVRKKVEIGGDQVDAANAISDMGKWNISLALKQDGAQRFLELSQLYNQTNGTTGQVLPFAIVLDGVVISNPIFTEAIAGGNARISGDFSESEARGLASAMQNPLQAPMKILHEEFFPPTLAKAAIDQGIRSTVIGISLTILFMLIFYRLAGLVALIGLTVNMILLFGVLAIFGADFTLTGIAGVILTLGMSIDANVLIYERLREERAAGKSLRASITTAYDKAFSAIFDANLTTLITALILFSVAVGAIKGFAVTLSIGIVVSLFSALLVTRVFFTWGHDTNLIKKLNFMSVLSNRAFDFLGQAKVSRIVSAVLIVIGIVLIAVKGGDSLGIDFTGGKQLRFQVDSGVTTEAVQASVDKIELAKDARVQILTPLGDTMETVSIRISDTEGESERILAQLEEDNITPASDPETKEIGSTVAGEMKSKSIYALTLGLFAILVYVTIRFEFSFALGAIVAVLHDLIIAAGIVVLAGKEINLVTVGAFLTIAGYSINDTIVVFDRIRENLRTKRGDVKDVMNLAINTTLSRTLLTSVTTLLTLLALYLAGGPALSDFSFTVIVGIIIGTYSSIFVASPIVYWWAKVRGTDLRHEVLEAEQEKLPPADMDLAPDA